MHRLGSEEVVGLVRYLPLKVRRKISLILLDSFFEVLNDEFQVREPLRQGLTDMTR